MWLSGGGQTSGRVLESRFDTVVSTLSRSAFEGQWCADMRDKLIIRRATAGKIGAGDGQAEYTIGRASYYVGVLVILAVVLPPADGAERVDIGLVESQKTTAHATGTIGRHARSDAGSK